jgi:hypothetical protein
MADLPNGPLPDVGALKSRVRAILEEAGVASLTMDTLCERLRDEYQINMQSHFGVLSLILRGVTKKPAMTVASPARRVARRTNNRRKWAKKENAPNNATKKNEPKPALSPRMIFGNERRPAIMGAIRAKGETIDAAAIERQIAALWDAKRYVPMKYYTLAEKDKERYADEKVAFDLGETATPKRRDTSFKNAAQTHPTYQVASPSVAASAASVYSYAVGYLRPFLVQVGGSWIDPKMARNQRTRWAAQQLIAAGRGSRRAPACNHTLRVASGGTAPGQASLRRALLLVGLGELQELHELRIPEGPAGPTGACEFILSVLQEEAAARRGRHVGASTDAPVLSALASLRVVKAENVSLPHALIQHCAPTLTELECSQLSNNAHFDFPRCTRLESLSLRDWYCCPDTAWLGMSYLHTLRGVSLRDVPAAAIAAALPRLHTLHVDHDGDYVDFPVDEFYDELLPRLRSFHLEGAWPRTRDAPGMDDVRPLPLLDDLKWRGCDVPLPHPIMGARPSTLNIIDAALIEWMQAADGVGSDSPAVTSPISRVRALTFRQEDAPLDAATLAWLLRAAPHLRQLSFIVDNRDYVRWALSEEPAFAGLAHPGLRHVAIISKQSPLEVSDGCGVRLRQRHFPRLRRFTIDDEEFPVWIPRHAPPRRARRRKVF